MGGKGTVAKGSSVKYGTGKYDSQAHLGKGKGQKLLPPAAGEGYAKPTPNTGGAVVRDGVEGHGSVGRGYQTDAHSGMHHGKRGEAVGNKNDLHMDFNSPLYSEGRGLNNENPGHITASEYAKGNAGAKALAHSMQHSTKAEHMPRPSQTPHVFSRPPMKEAHGYSHGPSQRSGPHRLSGHGNAHFLGRK